MAQTELPPLTHHQILALVAPFSRSGRHVDLAASDRMARQVAFKPVAHGAITETPLLDNPSEGRFKLTRVLTVQGGLQARLTADGNEPADLLARWTPCRSRSSTAAARAMCWPSRTGWTQGLAATR